MSLQSIEKKDYYEIESQRTAAIYLNDRKLHELVLIILETLRRSFAIVKNETNLSERTKRSQDIKGAIEQIEEMYADKNKEIIAKAKEILKEIELQTS
jgi:hypothetical protein